MKFYKLFLIFCLVLILTSGVNAVSSASYVTRQTYQPSFQTYYGSSISSYWPILADKDSCTARQDILLQISPAGCQPAVVRSDLIAEQNVPVFCQLDALKINPLVDIKGIRNIRFTGRYPKEVISVGFHPAQAALRTRDKLLGDPLVNNIGYVVIILKKNPNEKSLPDLVSLNLSAQLEYDSGNALGVGRAEFLLKEQSDSEWEVDKIRQSFWDGRYSVRLEEADDNMAVVSFYTQDRKVSSLRLGKGELSREVYVPGSYCRVGLQVQYVGFEEAKTSARIEVGTGNGTDVLEVYKGSRFLNDKCSVSDISLGSVKGSGNVSIRCPSGNIVLQLTPNGGEVYSIFAGENGERSVPFYENGKYIVDLNGRGKYRFDGEKSEYYDGSNWIDGAKGKLSLADFKRLEAALKEFKRAYDANPGSSSVVIDKTLNKNIQESYDLAVQKLGQVSTDYPLEADGKYGKESLENAIDLAKILGKESDRISFMKKYVELYSGERANIYKVEISQSNSIDYANSASVIELDNRFRAIRVTDIISPNKKSEAEFSVNAKTIRLKEGDVYSEGGKEIFRVAEVSASRVVLGSTKDCSDLKKRNLGLDEGTEACKKTIVFKKADVEKVVRIKIVPKVAGVEGETSFNVKLGIEKRAIQLSPDKTAERINNLNESIKKWEGISKNLGNVVSGLKGACFATAGILTAKNFVSGLSGAGFARQKVMRGENGWTAKCQAEVSKGESKSLDACFSKYSSEISRDVSLADEKIKEVNVKIKEAEKGASQSSGMFGTSIDTNKAVPVYKEQIVREFGTEQIEVGGKKVSVSELLSNKNGYADGEYSYEQLREMHYNLLMRKNGIDAAKNGAESSLRTIAGNIDTNRKFTELYNKQKSAKEEGFAVPFAVSAKGQNDRYVDVESAEKIRGKAGFSDSVTHTSTMVAQAKSGYSGGTYVLGLKENSGGSYNVVNVTMKNGDGDKATYAPVSGVAGFSSAYNLGNIYSQKKLSYRNKYLNPEVRFHETAPYKGMPAIVPLDENEGWYAATKQVLPVFGGQGAFDSSGRVTSFWLCNVGDNGREQFFEGLGDDVCEMVNLNTGQPLNEFPNLSPEKAKSLVRKATSSLEEAARQRESSRVSLTGIGNYKVGKPALNLPSAQCQDFMSPGECSLIFNVCDPVICPPTRCDFGGKYPVADVVQTGVVGSALLCLPNFPEVKVPVCLTGIQAGIDGYVSLLKSHKQCLQESLDSGKMIGICDQIYSVYTCEFFWRQLAPLAKVLVPKILESAYGQNVRGGGEYLTVMGAWQNTQNSVNYFTQTYGINTLKAFQARSVEEAGGEFCKSFVSLKAPTSLKSVLQPDSPTQFHAYFSSIKYSDATVPATAQYKVFYHIFAGNDAGVSYRVYLKGAPEISYYSANAYIPVNSGFIKRGEYATETRDLTAPEGYKELCVNINGEEKCGFKEVSTSFAVNYVRDVVVADEIKNKKISSEKECISGSVSAASLLNPNIESAAQEALNPDQYRRGIVRICATQNPGISTDPTRFVQVGYCDDAKVSCWLDQKSVSNAITDNNAGVKNRTLSALAQSNIENLKKDGVLFSEENANAELDSLEGFVKSLEDKTSKSNSISTQEDNEIKGIINRIGEVRNALYLNHHKAELLYIEGRIYKAITLRLANKGAVGSSGSSTTGTSNTTGNSVVTAIADKGLIKLEKVYNSNEKIFIYYDSEKTGFSLNKNILQFNTISIGSVENGNLVLKDGIKTKILNDFVLKDGEKKILDSINGMKIADLGVYVPKEVDGSVAEFTD